MIEALQVVGLSLVVPRWWWCARAIRWRSL